MTPNELYNWDYDESDITTDIQHLAGCYYCHIPELEAELQHWGYSSSSAQQDRIKIKTVKYHSFDGRRIWHLATVWFDDNPIMVTQNAGREGDDHAKRFVTDAIGYKEMVTYLRSLIPIEWRTDDLVGAGDDVPDLTRFYDHTLNGYFDFWR